MDVASSSFSTTAVTGLDFQTLMESQAFITYAKSNKCEIKKFMLKGTCSDFENLRFDVIWENATLEFDENPDDWEISENNVHDSSRNVNDTWEYKNCVPNTEVTLERKYKTKAAFSLTWLEGNTSGLGLNTSLKLPDEAREVFGESTFLDINGPSFETHKDHELKIGVKVPVPVNQKIKLVTVLSEKHFKGNFSSRAYLRGKVSVHIFEKESNELLDIVTDDVTAFLWKMRKEISDYDCEGRSADSIAKRLLLFHAVSVEQKHIEWKISGECCFSMGTHGSVKVESVK